MYIRKRRGRWQVTIKRKDLKASVKTFLFRKDAFLWGSKEEVRLTKIIFFRENYAYFYLR